MVVFLHLEKKIFSPGLHYYAVLSRVFPLSNNYSILWFWLFCFSLCSANVNNNLLNLRPYFIYRSKNEAFLFSHLIYCFDRVGFYLFRIFLIYFIKCIQSLFFEGVYFHIMLLTLSLYQCCKMVEMKLILLIAVISGTYCPTKVVIMTGLAKNLVFIAGSILHQAQ